MKWMDAAWAEVGTDETPVTSREATIRLPRPARYALFRANRPLTGGSHSAPATPHPLSDEIAATTKRDGSVYSRNRGVANWHQDRLPRVSGLVAPRSPAAVSGGIRAVVVFPVESAAARPFAHVGKECSKVVTPPLAYVNPSPTISVKIRTMRVVASPPHIYPSLIFCGSPRPMLRVCGCGRCDPAGCAEAATRSGFSVSKISDADGALDAAGAPALSLSADSGENAPAAICSVEWFRFCHETSVPRRLEKDKCSGGENAAYSVA